MYWYSLIDLDPRREAIEGFHVDENEYHLGLVTCDGTRKPAFDVMKDLLKDRSRAQPPPAPARGAPHAAAPHGAPR
jgi:CDP-paratose 2-epimerase